LIGDGLELGFADVFGPGDPDAPPLGWGASVGIGVGVGPAGVGVGGSVGVA
jgi:hypothetical protein